MSSLIDYKNSKAYKEYTKALDYYKSRGYTVQLRYNHFENPTEESNSDVLYHVTTNGNVTFWLYMIILKKEQNATMEIDPKYVGNVDLSPFYKRVTRVKFPNLKLYFKEFEDVKECVSQLCDNMDIIKEEKQEDSVYKSTSSYKALIAALDYYESRGYSLDFRYNHFDNPSGKTNNDILYCVYANSGIRFIVYMYMASEKSHYVSMEVEPEYAKNVNLSSFYKVTDKTKAPHLKLWFRDFESVKEPISQVCDNLDGIKKEKYWPPLEEYNPGFTKDDWLKLLNDKSIFDNNSLFTMAAFYDFGGEATCKQLALKYGNDAGFYSIVSSKLCKRIIDKTGCPKPPEEENSLRWPVLFVGRKVASETPGTYSWKLRDELKEALKEFGIEKYLLRGENEVKFNKNIILYGPPGTGKTYNTVCYAVAIIEKKDLKDVQAEDYSEIIERYNKYKADGRVEFTTFHQSYGYEEFIEGIRPTILDEEEDNKTVGFDVESGIFKKFCDKALVPVSRDVQEDYGINSSPTIWKVSLEKTGNNPTRTECMLNNHIRIGYDSYGESITDATDFSVEGGKSILNSFIFDMNIGDIVMSCYSAKTIDAIGVITGDYEWHDEFEEYKRVRNVKWIVKGINEDITEANGKNMTLPTVYRLKMTLSDVLDIVKKYNNTSNVLTPNKDNYVFIIDEINRGNISKIFGELITLIEPSKRIGQLEGMKISLPYSKDKPFGVPDNVYIIGTMNTADRSIAMIDTALRRRFAFKEMLPDASIFEDVYVSGLSIKDMLENMNRKISVLFDREHTIGHAYFIDLLQPEKQTVDELALIFKSTIIPLLQEYFYEDYDKIRLVLGDNKKKDESLVLIKAISNDYQELFDADLDADVSYRYEINDDAFNHIDAYKYI